MLLMMIPHPAYATGGADIRDMFLGLFSISSGLWVTIAVIAIVVAGFTLMISQDEGATEKAKKTIVAVMIGGITITLLKVLGWNTIIGFVYNGLPGMKIYNCGVAGNLPAAYNCGSALNLALEAEGVASWIATIAAILGVLMIIIAMVEAVASFGADEGAYDKVRTALLHVVLGLIVIVAALLIRNVFFVIREPSALLAFVTNKLLVVLGIITLIAVAILIYAGFRMVISFGREEDFSAAKSLMLRVITGLIILCISYALIYTLVTVFNS